MPDAYPIFYSDINLQNALDDMIRNAIKITRIISLAGNSVFCIGESALFSGPDAPAPALFFGP